MANLKFLNAYPNPTLLSKPTTAVAIAMKSSKFKLGRRSQAGWLLSHHCSLVHCAAGRQLTKCWSAACQRLCMCSLAAFQRKSSNTQIVYNPGFAICFALLLACKTYKLTQRWTMHCAAGRQLTKCWSAACQRLCMCSLAAFQRKSSNTQIVYNPGFAICFALLLACKTYKLTQRWTTDSKIDEITVKNR